MSTATGDHVYDDLSDPAGHRIVTADGARYRLESRLFSPRVVRLEPDGMTRTVVSQPW
jgi:hypothetical protein